jgi:hemerythrin superfamily protein
MPRRNTASRTDAIALLRKDHADVAALFEEFETAAESDKEDIADGICTLLTVHATCEEELLYPAAHEALDDDGLVFEAEIEHGSVRDLIAQIEVLAIEDPRFDASVRVLRDYVRHHVEEEEKELFPRLRKTDLDLVALAGSISARKQQLLDGTMSVDDPAVDDEEGDEEEPDPARRRRVGYAAIH